MLNLTAKTIAHSSQRYDTCGDYFYKVNKKNKVISIEFRISNLGNWKYEALIFLHEFIEFILIVNASIPLEVIDAFDKQFENFRKPGDNSEPGNSLECPYRKQHRFATKVERMTALLLGVRWEEYEKAISLLDYPVR